MSENTNFCSTLKKKQKNLKIFENSHNIENQNIICVILWKLYTFVVFIKSFFNIGELKSNMFIFKLYCSYEIRKKWTYNDFLKNYLFKKF